MEYASGRVVTGDPINPHASTMVPSTDLGKNEISKII
jgi:hypothetical protein